MNKNVFYGKDAREKLLSGVRKITDAVRVTMGASGKCVLIGNSAVDSNSNFFQLPSVVTKDGWTVAKNFNIPDLAENRGAMLVKEAAAKTVAAAGDATTCTCILADAIVSEGMKLIDEGANSQELKKGIDIAVEDVVRALNLMSIPIKGDYDKMFHLATVSANNDEAIGRMVADAFQKVGPEGIVDFEQSKGIETEIKLADGYRFQQSWVSNLFVNNRDRLTVEFTGNESEEGYCLILLYDKKILHHSQIERPLAMAASSQKPLLVICDGAAEEGLAYVISNVMARRVACCIVTAPGYGDSRSQAMEDLELITGATYISDIRGHKIAEMELEQFGKAKKVVVTSEETTIIGGKRDEQGENALLDMILSLRKNLSQAKSEEEKAPIEERIATLQGGVALIRVGAATETEAREKMFRYEDAIKATKSAISEGIVAGGGTAFLNISDSFSKYGLENSDQGKGYMIVKKALEKPLLQMAENAGANGHDILGKIRAHPKGHGYNTIDESIRDMVEYGIIDSTKALRCALTNAASVAGMILISECLMEAAW